MNKIILSQLFDVALEVNGFSNDYKTLGNTKPIEDVLKTFQELLKATSINS